MVRRNMDKIHYALTHLELDSQRLDAWNRSFSSRSRLWRTSGSPVLLYPTTEDPWLGDAQQFARSQLTLASLDRQKIPIVMKPEQRRTLDTLPLDPILHQGVGCPKEAFGFYPTDHEGAGDILRMCGRALIFGDKSTTDLYAGDPGVQVHGPGFSKILIGEDEIEIGPTLWMW